MAFSYYSSITVDKTKVPNTDQTDFPVGFIGVYTDLKSVGNSGFMQNGSAYDINFYSDSGLTTALKYERVYHNLTTGEVEYWIKIPTLTTGTNYVFYVAFGDSGISTDQSDSTNTWNTNFQGVLHFGSPSTINVNDTSSYAVTGTNNNSVTSTTGAFGGGTLGGSANLNGTNQSISYGNNFGITGDLTFSFWANIQSHDYAPVINKTNAGTGIAGPIDCNWGYGFNHLKVSQGNGTTGSGETMRTTTGPTKDSNWHFFVFRRSSTNWYWRENGSANGSGTDSTTRTNQTYTMHVGKNSADNWYFNGQLDEIRFSDTYRSNDWCDTERNNQNSPSTFYTVGSKQSAGAAFLAPQRKKFNQAVFNASSW